MNVTEKMRYVLTETYDTHTIFMSLVLRRIENIVGKGENASY